MLEDHSWRDGSSRETAEEQTTECREGQAGSRLVLGDLAVMGMEEVGRGTEHSGLGVTSTGWHTFLQLGHRCLGEIP